MESENLVQNDFDAVAKELVIQTVDIMVKENLNLNSKSDIVPILRIVMEAIEEKEMTGPQQKDIAKLVLQSVIKESKMDDEHKNLCLELIDNGIIENTIQLISDASKGKLKINKKKAKVALAQCLLDCLKSFNKSKNEETSINKI